MCVDAQSYLTLCDPKDCSPPALLSVGFYRQDYWSKVPFPTPEDLLDPVIKHTSLVSPALAGRLFTTSSPGSV